ncbi:MAG: AarF/ABC1/UbiB kinase family protein [Sandaracinaceae bacterium]|nr:AarF/ABC1/UbiB kinase family protein [Sandaracinaceae bacterium]
MTTWTRASYAAAVRGAPPVDDAMRELVAALRALERASGDEEARALEDRAFAILAEQGVHARRSRLSSAYGDVHRAAAAAREGDPFTSTWSRLMAGYCDGVEVGEDATNAAAGHALGLALASHPEVTATRAAEIAPPEWITDADLRGRRLAGGHFEVLAMADACRRGAGDADAARWHEACARAHLSADPGPLVDEQASWTAAQLRVVALLTHAAPQKHAAERAAAVVGATGAEVELLARLRDPERPMHDRLREAGAALAELRRAEADPETALLVLAGITRWLLQAKHFDPARVVASAARALSLELSAGQTEDSLGFLLDVHETFATSASSSSASRSVPVTRWSRAGGTASLLLALTAKLGVSRTRALFTSKKRATRLRRAELDALVETAATRLDALKGPLLKVAQQASTMGLELSPAIERRLIATRARGTPVPFEAIEACLERELGRPWPVFFRELEEAPIGVGSIGQVHAGQLHDGTEVAVKVRLPGIRDAIRHDLLHLSLLVPVAVVLRPKVDWRGIVAMLRESLLAECDYRREAAVQEAFRRHFADDPGLSVPRVVPECSTQGVLTMERVFGCTLGEVAEEAGFEERRRFGEALLRLHFAFVAGGYAWSDPHPGNYVFGEDRVHVLDFGCVPRWDAAVRLRWVRLGQAMMERDEAGLKRGIRELGFPVDADHFDYQEFVAKFHPDYYTDDVDEGGAALHSANIVTEQLRELFSRRSTNYHNVQIPPDLILGLRAFYGTLFVLSRLRVGIDPSRPSFRRAVEAAVLSAEAMATPPP